MSQIRPVQDTNEQATLSMAMAIPPLVLALLAVNQPIAPPSWAYLVEITT